MALRVLLADESSTIKKVFQLSLQDYAVEVVTVNVGLDVIDVAHRFRPDIVFADVLLPKRGGYDVSSDLKADRELGDVPVVLVWSGFMELDQDKFQASNADAQLEKPFDARQLRQLIQQLVPKTKTQKISQFLTFPTMPEFQEGEVAARPAPPAPSAGAGGLEMATSPPPFPDEDTMTRSNVLGSDLDDFQQVQLAAPEMDTHSQASSIADPSPQEILSDSPEDDEGGWVQKTISNYRLELDHDDETGSDAMKLQYVVPEDSVSTTAPPPIDPDTSYSNDVDGEDSNEYAVETAPPAPASQVPHLSADEIETIIRAQSADVIESVVWKVVPDLAKQIIERELKKLLDEQDQSL